MVRMTFRTPIFAVLTLGGVCLGPGVPVAPAQAQDTEPDTDAAAEVQTIPSPCLSWQYRAFDFWVGDWDVFDADGQYVGRNVVSIEENGCLIHERWQSVNGTTGQSFNFYNPAADAWRQVWVSQSVTIDYSGGFAADGGIALDGEITYRDGMRFPFRGSWTPNRNGTITQIFEQFDPETSAWAPWFVGIYRRVEDNPETTDDETGDG